MNRVVAGKCKCVFPVKKPIHKRRDYRDKRQVEKHR